MSKKKKRGIISLLVVAGIVAVIGFTSVYLYSQSLAVPSAYTGTYTVRWKDEAGNYRTGYASGNPLGVFYVGETVKGLRTTYTLTDIVWGHPAADTKCEVTIRKTVDGPVLYSGSKTGGALQTGQTATFDFPLNIHLADSSWEGYLSASIQFSIYGGPSYPVWHGVTSISNQPCNVVVKKPSFTISSFLFDKESTQIGDTITVSYTITNTGQISSALIIYLYPDPWERGFMIDPQDAFFRDSPPTIQPGGTYSNVHLVTVLEEHVSTTGFLNTCLLVTYDSLSVQQAKKIEVVSPPEEPPVPPEEPAKYKMTVYTVPYVCRVTVDGMEKMSTTYASFELEEGMYTVSVSKTGYVTSTQQVSISSEKLLTVSLSPVSEPKEPEPEEPTPEREVPGFGCMAFLCALAAVILIGKTRKRVK